jgi:hypothetical protein
MVATLDGKWLALAANHEAAHAMKVWAATQSKVTQKKCIQSCISLPKMQDMDNTNKRAPVQHHIMTIDVVHEQIRGGAKAISVWKRGRLTIPIECTPLWHINGTTVIWALTSTIEPFTLQLSDPNQTAGHAGKQSYQH